MIPQQDRRRIFRATLGRVFCTNLSPTPLRLAWRCANPAAELCMKAHFRMSISRRGEFTRVRAQRCQRNNVFCIAGGRRKAPQAHHRPSWPGKSACRASLRHARGKRIRTEAQCGCVERQSPSRQPPSLQAPAESLARRKQVLRQLLRHKAPRGL